MNARRENLFLEKNYCNFWFDVDWPKEHNKLPSRSPFVEPYSIEMECKFSITEKR